MNEALAQAGGLTDVTHRTVGDVAELDFFGNATAHRDDKIIKQFELFDETAS